MIEPIKDIVAERILIFVAEDDGQETICRLFFLKPYKIKENWYQCDYQILGGALEYQSKDYGVDSLDALLSAVTKAKIDLELRFQGKFYFEGTENLQLVIKDYTEV